jgi:hypothetical protein
VPTECNPSLFEFARVEGRAVVASFDGGRMTSDAGAVLLGAADRVIGLTRQLAGCFTDARNPAFIEHEVETLVMQRVVGIALGYEDLIDHDELRHDPVLATLAGKLAARRSNCAPLAGKSTLNRLELSRSEPTLYAKLAADAAAIEALFIDLFLDAHRKTPEQITLDLDATDDPLHGHQEGRFFHGYYDCYTVTAILLDLPLLRGWDSIPIGGGLVSAIAEADRAQGGPASYPNKGPKLLKSFGYGSKLVVTSQSDISPLVCLHIRRNASPSPFVLNVTAVNPGKGP